MEKNSKNINKHLTVRFDSFTKLKAIQLIWQSSPSDHNDLHICPAIPSDYKQSNNLLSLIYPNRIVIRSIDTRLTRDNV